MTIKNSAKNGGNPTKRVSLYTILWPQKNTFFCSNIIRFENKTEPQKNTNDTNEKIAQLNVNVKTFRIKKTQRITQIIIRSD